jgi:hypothetical protein
VSFPLRQVIQIQNCPHGGDFDEYCLLESDALWSMAVLMFYGMWRRLLDGYETVLWNVTSLGGRLWNCLMECDVAWWTAMKLSYGMWYRLVDGCVTFLWNVTLLGQAETCPNIGPHDRETLFKYRLLTAMHISFLSWISSAFLIFISCTNICRFYVYLSLTVRWE